MIKILIYLPRRGCYFYLNVKRRSTYFLRCRSAVSGRWNGSSTFKEECCGFPFSFSVIESTLDASENLSCVLNLWKCPQPIRNGGRRARSIWYELFSEKKKNLKDQEEEATIRLLRKRLAWMLAQWCFYYQHEKKLRKLNDFSNSPAKHHSAYLLMLILPIDKSDWSISGW